MNAWASEEDAWWWSLWRPGMLGGSEEKEETKDEVQPSHASRHEDQPEHLEQREEEEEEGTVVYVRYGVSADLLSQGSSATRAFDNWIAVQSVQSEDLEGVTSAFDPHSGWGVGSAPEESPNNGVTSDAPRNRLPSCPLSRGDLR
eukprot:748461-Hanusia_phi.AAC.1